MGTERDSTAFGSTVSGASVFGGAMATRTESRLLITTDVMKKIRVLTPGEVLLAEFIRPNNFTVYRVAKDSGIPQSTLQLIVTGKRAITADTALKLATCFDVDAQFWLNLQSEYDLRLARQQS